MILGTTLLLSSLITQCGAGVDPSTTSAIIKVESGGNPYAIGDNTTRQSYSPNSKEDAIKIARHLLNKGHSLDMGLMQINSNHLKSGRFNLNNVFEPCENIKIGNSILIGFYKKYDTEPDKSKVLFKALSAYNTGTAWKGQGYVNKILKAANSNQRIRLSPVQNRVQTAALKREVMPESSGLFFNSTQR